MQFQVPQFIEVEDKIFGPLTLKQFLYLLGSGAAVFLLYILLPFFLFILLAIPVGGFGLALAFYKVNNQPFIKVIENAIKHFTRTKIFIWKKRPPKVAKTPSVDDFETPGVKKATLGVAPKLTKRKLNDLAWNLDTKKEIKH